MDNVGSNSRHLKVDVTIYGLTHFGVCFVFMVVMVREFSCDSQPGDQHD